MSFTGGPNGKYSKVSGDFYGDDGTYTVSGLVSGQIISLGVTSNPFGLGTISASQQIEVTPASPISEHGEKTAVLYNCTAQPWCSVLEAWCEDFAMCVEPTPSRQIPTSPPCEESGWQTNYSPDNRYDPLAISGLVDGIQVFDEDDDKPLIDCSWRIYFTKSTTGDYRYTVVYGTVDDEGIAHYTNPSETYLYTHWVDGGETYEYTCLPSAWTFDLFPCVTAWSESSLKTVNPTPVGLDVVYYLQVYW